MEFVLLHIVWLLVIIFLCIIISWIYPPDSPWAPWWRTSQTTARRMCILAKVEKDDLVYDLGSGDGTALLIAVKEFGAKGIGIEIDLLRVFISKLKIRQYHLEDKIQIKRKNFFDEDLSKATVVYVYLVPKALERLRPKLLKELKSGTKLVSLIYEIDLPLVAYDQKHNLRLYRVP